MQLELDSIEWSMMTYVASGLTDEEIGRALGITEDKAASTICELMNRLGLADRFQVTLFVYSHWRA